MTHSVHVTEAVQPRGECEGGGRDRQNGGEEEEEENGEVHQNGENDERMEQERHIREGRILPRPNIVGPMPTLYHLPDMSADILDAIEKLGPRIDPTNRRKIADTIRDDMLKFSSYA